MHATGYLLGVVLLVGCAGSVIGARSWENAVRTENQRAFQATATGVADTLTMSLQRDADVMAMARTLVASDPTMDNKAFSNWFASLGSTQRFPGSFDFAYVQRVTLSQLPAFTSTVEADPPLGFKPSGGFTLTPVGFRSQYCLMRLTAVELGSNTPITPSKYSTLESLFSNFLDPMYDECAGQIGPLLQRATATGELTIGSFTSVLTSVADANPSDQSSIKELFGSLSPIEMVLPVYSIPAPGAPSQLLGWVGGVYDANQLLDPITHVKRGLALVLSNQGPGGLETVGRVGHLGANGPVTTFDLGAEGHWILQLSGSVGNGWSPATQGGALLGGGLLVTLLLVLLIRVLTSSRQFALDLVDEKTTELRHRAGHDALTDLPNRTLILELSDHARARARANGTSVTLLFIDLDGFKDVNDAHGHGVGDALLRAVAERFAEMLGENDTMGRLGGDEFIVLSEGSSASGPELLASRLLTTCEEPFQLDSLPGVTLTVSASIGIAREEHDSSEELLRDADIALYQAKTAGRNQFVVFKPEMRDAVWRRVDLRNELHAALEERQFFLAYQPLFDLSTMHITGMEALLRWQHPTRGMVPPFDFIDTLEESGLIVDVGRWVLSEACRQTKRWHDMGLPLTTSVNVSGRQLEYDDLVLDVMRALEEADLDPHAIVVEMTETALMRDAESVARRLWRLKDVGVRIAIDDFGTGYSSLAYLHQFPADCLKIDRSFIEAMSEGNEGLALVHATVQLGKVLGLETLAEGIERQSQLDMLRAEGCDSGQGFLVARPMRPDDAEQFLAAHVVVGKVGAGEEEVGDRALDPLGTPAS